MYLPTNPNSSSREINSLRRSAAASLNVKHQLELCPHTPVGRGTIPGETGCPLPICRSENEKSSRIDAGYQDTYKHGKEGKRLICPWCISEETHRPGESNVDIHDVALYYKNDVSRELYVLDDRLYDYIEKHAGISNTQENKEDDMCKMNSLCHEMVGPGQFLRYCVKASQLVSALTDDDYFLDSCPEKSSSIDLTKRVIDGETTQSSEQSPNNDLYGSYRKVSCNITRR